MKTPSYACASLLAVIPALACLPPPDCIEGPSNLNPAATASCVAPPQSVPVETDIVSAGAEVLDDGTLVLTWSSWGLACGVRALDIELARDCQTTGWTMTAEIPPELVRVGMEGEGESGDGESGDGESGEGESGDGDPGTLSSSPIIDFAEHPEIRGTLAVLTPGAGGSTGSFGDEPFFVGTLELIAVGEDCVTGVLHGFGTGNPDPTLGGPELDGAFMAPRC